VSISNNPINGLEVNVQQSDCTEPNKNFQRHILFIDSQYTSNEDIECRAGKTRSNRLASQKII